MPQGWDVGNWSGMGRQCRREELLLCPVQGTSLDLIESYFELRAS